MLVREPTAAIFVVPRTKRIGRSGAKRILRRANDNEMPAKCSLISWPLFQ